MAAVFTFTDPKKEALMGVVIDTKELAALLRKAPFTIKEWRMRGVGPAYTKVGNKVIYSREEVARWLAENTYLTNEAAA